MSCVYLYERGAQISIRNNRIVVEQRKTDMLRSIPIEGVEAICIIGEVAFTSPCIKEFLMRGIQLLWLSDSGEYFGKLCGTEHQNVLREARQFENLRNEAFCLAMAKKWTCAKIKNQITLLRRYERAREADISGEENSMKQSLHSIDNTTSINELMGYEGVAAKSYYNALAKLVPAEFAFRGRNRRPPTDRFNSLLSFAYTLLLYEVFSTLAAHGLNPYVGNMHALRNGHPSLCSDLMEEWRPVIADSLVMSMVCKHSVVQDDFLDPAPSGGVYLKADAAKRFIAEFEKKIRTQARYLAYVDFPVSFRRAIELQAGQYVKAIEAQDSTPYQSVVIR